MTDRTKEQTPPKENKNKKTAECGTKNDTSLKLRKWSIAIAVVAVSIDYKLCIAIDRKL